LADDGYADAIRGPGHAIAGAHGDGPAAEPVSFPIEKTRLTGETDGVTLGQRNGVIRDNRLTGQETCLTDRIWVGQVESPNSFVPGGAAVGEGDSRLKAGLAAAIGCPSKGFGISGLRGSGECSKMGLGSFGNLTFRSMMRVWRAFAVEVMLEENPSEDTYFVYQYQVSTEAMG
jgi:hypothetical protein